MPLNVGQLETTTKGSAAPCPPIYCSCCLLVRNQVSVKPLLVHLLQMEASAAVSSVPCHILGLLYMEEGIVQKICCGDILCLC